MALTSGHRRHIQNSFRVKCFNVIGASESVHIGETLWLSATPHSYFAPSNNIDHLFLVIRFGLLPPNSPISSLSLWIPQSHQGDSGTMPGAPLTQPPNAWVSLRTRRSDIFRRRIRHTSMNGVAITWWIYMFVHLVDLIFIFKSN